MLRHNAADSRQRIASFDIKPSVPDDPRRMEPENGPVLRFEFAIYQDPQFLIEKMGIQNDRETVLPQTIPADQFRQILQPENIVLERVEETIRRTSES